MNRIREEISNSLSITSRDNDNFEAEFALTSDFTGFQGHFTGNPILPGVCMLEAVVAAVNRALGISLHITGVKKAKFFAPVSPDTTVKLEISLDRQENMYLISAGLSCDNRRVAVISLAAS